MTKLKCYGILLKKEIEFNIIMNQFNFIIRTEPYKIIKPKIEFNLS